MSLGYYLLYKISFKKLKVYRDYIIEKLSLRFIKPSSALFTSPVLIARISSSKLWFYVNYRKLNTITKKNRYPLSLINKILQHISKTKIFTKLDIRQSFYQIRIYPDLEDLIIFRLHYSFFKYKIILFRLTNILVTF